MKPLSVLVVDDEAGIRRVLTRALSRLGMTVHLATTGEEACEILGGTPVDVVLMDLRMPSMSGQTLYHLITTQWPLLAARVIIMSGDPEAEDHEDWLSLQRMTVLAKPFDIHQVVELIEKITAAERREANGQ
jgi:CheY-like chemotaxis protein